MSQYELYAEKWLQVAEHLQRLAEIVPATDWLPKVKATKEPYPEESDRSVSREAMWMTFSQILQEYIAGWQWLTRQRDDMPSFSEPAKYWLRASVYHGATFCRQHVCATNAIGPSTIVSFPDSSDLAFYVWLSVEWWPQVGLQAAVLQATSDANLFYAGHVS